MWNGILILGLLLNLVAGFAFIAGFEPVVWGERGIFRSGKSKPRNGAPLEWEHACFYLPDVPEDHENT